VLWLPCCFLEDGFKKSKMPTGRLVVVELARPVPKHERDITMNRAKSGATGKSARTSILALSLLGLATLAFGAFAAGCGDSSSSGGQKPAVKKSGGGPVAADNYSRPKTPKEYDEMKNPFAATPEMLAEAANEGKSIFAGKCVTCHGTLGIGDGPTGVSATPKPRDLTNVLEFHEKVSDGYIYWRILKGAEPYKGPGGSIMTQFETGPDKLTPEQIWKVVSYVRTLGKR